MDIKTFGIVGTGRSARVIAELAAFKGYDVIVWGEQEGEFDSFRKAVDSSLQQKIDRWAITSAEKKVTVARIELTTDLTKLADADFVIETLVTDVEYVNAHFTRLDEICKPETILASNTSTLSITEFGAHTMRPDRVIGVHFMHPVTQTQVVEIARGLKTSDAVVATVRQLIESLGRTPVESYESIGLITSRLLVPLVNEACAMLMEGVAAPEEIDKAIRVGFSMPAGPLEMADRMGLDTFVVICERMWHETGDNRYRPAPNLKKLARAGLLGAETGEGFFRYDGNGARIKEGK
ncbi:MAG TPA: 3-hydroxyacyl-CoA dehydrogenase NAD-binding domain-containing protein [Symbiobacteriaceae bacterium]|nr:3-hydroxyacyl-CoA dehydrogenase NAD-binding domain-containing protein [Symbiobacteriaceae bacterium]